MHGTCTLKKKYDAICFINTQHSGDITGTITLYKKGTQTVAKCNLKGLSPGLHGFHVHECGDFSKGCASTCSHYNSDGKTHGGPTGENRHKGDFGNIYADEYGVCVTEVTADVLVDEIIGRAFIVHADEDDLGQGGDEESLKTGNAGARIACGLIVK